MDPQLLHMWVLLLPVHVLTDIVPVRPWNLSEGLCNEFSERLYCRVKNLRLYDKDLLIDLAVLPLYNQESCWEVTFICHQITGNYTPNSLPLIRAATSDLQDSFCHHGGSAWFQLGPLKERWGHHLCNEDDIPICVDISRLWWWKLLRCELHCFITRFVQFNWELECGIILSLALAGNEEEDFILTDSTLALNTTRGRSQHVFLQSHGFSRP